MKTVKIHKMPTKRMLELFLAGFHGNGVQVLFNEEKGEFEYTPKGQA